MSIRRSTVALAALLAAAGLALGSLSACSPAKRVLVIGDSLTVSAAAAGLGADHPWQWTISAEDGRGTNRGIAIARDRDIAAYDLVIVALGTNDYLDDAVTYRTRIDNMMAALADAPRVIWINVDSHTPHLAPAALGVNPAIAAAPGRHSKLTAADWDAYVATVPDMDDYRRGDQIHYNAAGDDLRARWMESLVA
ncbi:MAG: hypothetical protein KDA97_03530 [Acidimicrobiales bacterium]|nr:hypothetical protein [Acidimicrobiales bacterium]